MKLIHPNGDREAHPLALILPPLAPAAYETLKSRIKDGGLRQPIVLLDGKILDGIHRYKACIDTGIAPDFEHFNPKVHGESPARYSIDANLHRRHLTASQQAAVAADFLPYFEAEAKARKEAAQFKPKDAEPVNPARVGDSHPSNVIPLDSEPQVTTPKPPTEPVKGTAAGKSTDLVAQTFGTSATMIKLAKRIKKENSTLYDEVLTGKTTINAAVAILDAAEANSKDKDEKEKERKERAEAIKVLEDKYGPTSQVVTAVRKRSILKKNDELQVFADLPPDSGKVLLPHLAKGWTLAQTQKYVKGELTTDSTIDELLKSAEAADTGDETKPFVRTFGAYTVTITKA